MMGTWMFCCGQFFDDVRDGGGGGFVIDGDADEFGTGAGQRGDLGDGAGNVGGVGVGHGLHHDRGVGADADGADSAGDGFAAENLGHGMAYFSRWASGIRRRPSAVSHQPSVRRGWESRSRSSQKKARRTGYPAERRENSLRRQFHCERTRGPSTAWLLRVREAATSLRMTGFLS